jgi:hypothetical protein
MTSTGLMAIPQGALISVVEDSTGQKYAVFRQVKIPVTDMLQFSDDPSQIAAASAKATTAPGAAPTSNNGYPMPERPLMPQSRTDEQIRLDENGNVIARSKTTAITDGSGNRTTIIQGNSSSYTGDRAAKIAMARAKIDEQEKAIWEFEYRRQTKAVVSGYESKLKAMKDLLVRMKAELARMEAEASAN